jgi:phage-related holin
MKFYLEIFNFSNLLNLRTGLVSITSGVVGSLLNVLYGGDLHVWFVSALVFAVVFDWAGGIVAAKKDGSYASAYGIQGVIRTAVMLALPAWGSIIDKIIGAPFSVFFFVFWGGILFHTLMSMTANFKRAGWDRWIPNWAIEWVASEINAKTQRAFERQQQIQINQQETTDHQKTTEMQ